ncbi:hypothetical protein Tco_0565234 [Tanacetum coccineum]
MSKRNLGSVTCSVTQSEFVEFIEEYGIAMCYDPQLPSFEQTALDALEGYIPLYLSLFSIGNLRLPFNHLCLDVFEFFKCHIPLLNPFGVARVMYFVVAYKAYKGEPSLYIFRSLYSNWKSEFIFVRETLVSEACPALITDFRHGLGTLAFPYHTKLIDETLRDRIMHHPFEAQTFSYPILYLAGLASSWEYAPNAPLIFVDRDGSPSVDHLKIANDNDQGESSPVSKNQDVAGLELAIFDDSPSDQGEGVAEGSRTKRSITAALEEGAAMIRVTASGSSSKHEAKRQKQKGPRRTSSRGSVPPLLVSAPKVGSQIVKDLRSENNGVSEELSMLREVVASTEDSQKKLSEELGRLRPFIKTQALNEIHGLRRSWGFKDVEDYNPNAERIFDEATKAFVATARFDQVRMCS